MNIRLFLVSIALALASSTAWAAEHWGRVVYIHDGDTVHIEFSHGVEKVRLKDIDTPELDQPFGISARATLRTLCPVNSVALADWTSRDRDGRVIADVTCAGVHVNRELVREGAAWVFVRYAARGSELYKVEAKARKDGIGLWSLPKPLPPWEWRRKKIRAPQVPK